MLEHFIQLSLGELAGLPQLLIEQHPLGFADASSPEWLALLHTGEVVPTFSSPAECQEYIARIGLDAELAVLAASDGDTTAVGRISQIVTLANQEMLNHPIFLDQETGPKHLHKYAEEIQKVIRLEVARGLNHGPVLQS